MRWFSLILVVFFTTCSRPPVSSGYKIGIDPSFNSLNLPERNGNLRAFCVELIEEIGKKENLDLVLYEVNWDALLWGLQTRQFQGIISSLQPYLFYQKTYTFSDLFLATGPVLVVVTGSSFSDLGQMDGKEIGIVRGSKDSLILEKYPSIIQRTYLTVTEALSALATGGVEGVLIDALTAAAYCNDLYQGQLKVASPPLSQDGLRLVSTIEQSPELIEKFNRGLERMKEDGSYLKLTQKWGLST